MSCLTSWRFAKCSLGDREEKSLKETIVTHWMTMVLNMNLKKLKVKIPHLLDLRIMNNKVDSVLLSFNFSINCYTFPFKISENRGDHVPPRRFTHMPPIIIIILLTHMLQNHFPQTLVYCILTICSGLPIRYCTRPFEKPQHYKNISNPAFSCFTRK